MSQPGLLSEDEIRGFINQNFDLKMDREALLRPSRDMITDIYTRFIEDLNLRWAQTEPIVEASMVRQIRTLLAPYNIAYTFCPSDLLTPTRKRTTTFLNVLIYVKALRDEMFADWQQWTDDWSVNGEAQERLNRETENLKLELEKAAFKRSSICPNQLKLDIEERKRVFSSVEQQSEALQRDGNKVKECIRQEVEDMSKEKKEVETKKKLMDNLKITLDLRSEGATLDENLLTARQNLAQLKLDCPEDNLESELEKEKSSIKACLERSASVIRSLGTENDSIKKEREKYDYKRLLATDKCNAYIEKRNRQYDLILKLNNQFSGPHEYLSTLNIIQTKLETLMGKTEIPANRTYIKESAS